MPAFDALHAAYRNRLEPARRAAAAGTKVVGVIGGAVPVELVHAAGCFAVQLTAEPGGPTDRADRFMEDLHERATRALFDRMLGGAFDFCAAIVIDMTSDANRHLFHYAKEIVRQGVRDTLPPLIAYDLMLGDGTAIRGYGLARTRELAERLRLIGGGEDIAGALAAAQRRRALLRRLEALRAEGRLRGVDALHVLGAGRFMAPEEFEQALTAFLAETHPTLTGPRVVIVPAVPLDHDTLHEAIERSGGVVVGEDDWWGSRAHDGDFRTQLPPLEAIFGAHYETTASPRAPEAKREAWLRRRLEAGGIDAAVVYIPPSDQDFGWSYPDLQRLLDGKGIPAVLLRDDILDASGAERIAAQLQAFIGGLR